MDLHFLQFPGCFPVYLIVYPIHQLASSPLVALEFEFEIRLHSKNYPRYHLELEEIALERKEYM